MFCVIFLSIVNINFRQDKTIFYSVPENVWAQALGSQRLFRGRVSHEVRGRGGIVGSKRPESSAQK